MNSPLTAGQRAQLRADLEARIETVQRQLQDHLHGSSRTERAHEVAQQDNDDAPQRAPEREVAMALSEHERAELVAMTAALDRVARSDFGLCADCEVQIPFDRLKVEPWALRCVACETKREQAVRP